MDTIGKRVIAIGDDGHERLWIQLDDGRKIYLDEIERERIEEEISKIKDCKICDAMGHKCSHHN